MITLITGTPGSGKTLRSMFLIRQALDQGRAVYSDIDGVTLENVLPAPDDWRDTPEGSLVVYDEVQRRWPSTGRPGHAPEEDIRALETHRHTGHDIIVITQHPTLVHHHVRKLVGEHVHVRRTSGAPVVTLFTASEVFDPKDKNELRNTDKQTWKYPKNLFTSYKSATAHTHKFKIPSKVKWLGLFLVVLVGGLVWAFTTQDIIPSTQETAPPRGQSAAAPAAGRSLPLADPRSGAIPLPPPVPKHWQTVTQAVQVATVPTIMGCVRTADKCRCWDADAAPLAVSYGQCEAILEDMPMMAGGYSTGSGMGSDDRSDDDSSTLDGVASNVSYAPGMSTFPGLRPSDAAHLASES